jgi:hypothetical protein
MSDSEGEKGKKERIFRCCRHSYTIRFIQSTELPSLPPKISGVIHKALRLQKILQLIIPLKDNLLLKSLKKPVRLKPYKIFLFSKIKERICLF